MKRNIRQYLAGVVVVFVIALVGVVIYWLANGIIWISNFINWKTIFENPKGILFGLFIGLFIDNLGTLALSIFNKITKGAVQRWFEQSKVISKEKKQRRKEKKEQRKQRREAKRLRREELYRNSTDRENHEYAEEL